MQSAAKQLSLFSVSEEPDALSGFSVRESSRARRLSIKVYPRGRVEVVVPKRTRSRDVQAFVAENQAWIRKTRAAFAAKHAPEPFRLPVRINLPAIERIFGVVYQPREGARTVRYRLNGDILSLYGKTDDEAQCVVALKRWLAATAREYFEPRLRGLSAFTGNSYKRMQVRGQKTCWGSHSSTGTISINYCLLFLAPAALRYLMIHELCHAQYMNHSRRFWRLVGRFEAQYRRLDRGLADSWKAIPTWVGLY
ncbi:MAG: M48 family metallopeptidase [Proteobacteria bacterium]|nr:M48 family metallopeptidase [Pseudomonadota bacterium]